MRRHGFIGVGLALAATALGLTGEAMAIALGELDLRSTLGHRLQALVPIIDDTDAPLSARFCFRTVAGAGAPEGIPVLEGVDLELRRLDGRDYLSATSRAPVSEPLAQFTVEIGCGLRFRRNYTLLLSPGAPPQAPSAAAAPNMKNLRPPAKPRAESPRKSLAEPTPARRAAREGRSGQIIVARPQRDHEAPTAAGRGRAPPSGQGAKRSLSALEARIAGLQQRADDLRRQLELSERTPHALTPPLPAAGRKTANAQEGGQWTGTLPLLLASFGGGLAVAAALFARRRRPAERPLEASIAKAAAQHEEHRGVAVPAARTPVLASTPGEARSPPPTPAADVNASALLATVDLLAHDGRTELAIAALERHIADYRQGPRVAHARLLELYYQENLRERFLALQAAIGVTSGRAAIGWPESPHALRKMLDSWRNDWGA